MSSGAGYRFVDLFVIRPTGVPFEVLDSLGMPQVSAAARDLVAHQQELSRVVQAAAEAIDTCEALSFGQRQRLRRKLFKRATLAAAPALPEVAEYLRLLPLVTAAETALSDRLARDYAACRDRIYELARAHLPPIAVLQLNEDALERMLATRTAKDDRSLAIWLQRVCSKNDTISRFGPSCWGHVDPDEPAVRLAPAPGIARNAVWIERWVVHGLIAVINDDPDTRAEVAPRVNPTIELVGTQVRWHETGVETELTAEDRELVGRCDGRTPAHQLGVPDQLARLAEAGIVIWKLEPMFVDDSPLATLAADLAGWRDGPARRRWSEVIREIAELGEAYQRDPELGRRREIIARLQARLVELQVPQRQRTGKLYEASNPLVENCTRTGDFVLGQRLVDGLLDDAGPWFDLFRDIGSVVTDHVYDGVRELYVKAPRPHGRVSLASFLAFAETCKVSLRGRGLIRFAHETYRELRQAFARRLAGRSDAPEWELTVDECRFLAGPGIPRSELQYPSVDLCIAAASVDAVARGEFRWVISELHHNLVLNAQSLSWSCPDRPKLYARVRDTNQHQAAAFYDAATSLDLPVHVGSETIIEALEGNVSSTWRTKPGWHTYPPTEVEVVLDEEHRDLRLRSMHTGADLGSMIPFARSFFGMHPFFPLQLAHHTPRLVRGRTVFQRRAWVIKAEELGGPFPEMSAALVVAVERLRAARALPRWVFLRLRDDVLSGAESVSRPKDVKPIYLDLESYVFIEIFARRLHKYGAVELVEMLPAPHELPWHESDGHRSFEIRSLLAPGRSG